MRGITVSVAAGLMLLAFTPATALAQHHRHHRHHVRHARIERFGARTSSTTTSSANDAGTVQSFSDGVLTIMMADGSAISGKVTSDTALECQASEPEQTGDESGGDSGQTGDQSGSGDSSQSGDDQTQGSGDQSGDDDQSDASDQSESDDEAENSCAMSNLTMGTAVREAELRISSDGSVWKKVELDS